MHFNKLVLTTMILGSTPISAAPLRWELQNVTFNVGRAAEGSFDFDADTDEYSNIYIYTGLDDPYGDEPPSGFISPRDMITVPDASLQDLTGEPYLSFFFDEPLTSFGGTVLINIDPQSHEGTCLNAGCSQRSPDREIASGYVVADPLPPPTTAMPSLSPGIFARPTASGAPSSSGKGGSKTKDGSGKGKGGKGGKGKSGSRSFPL